MAFASVRHGNFLLTSTTMLSRRPAFSDVERHHLRLTLGTIVPGIIFSTLLLASFAYLACKNASRKHLNRVSFRMLVYILIANLLFMILIPLDMAQFHRACAPVSFVRLFCLMFSPCMSFCILLNLQLVLVHGVNGNTMEKYYIIFSLLLCLACNIPPSVAGASGWSDGTGRCWLRNPNFRDELVWVIGTQSFWLLLMAAGEVISFLTITIFMARQEVRLRRMKNELSTSSASAGSLLVVRQAPVVKHRSTILRIGLYPLLSCVFSAMSTLLNVIGIYRRPGPLSPKISLLGLLIFIMRPVLYVLLAATDPGYLRALRALGPARPAVRPASMASQETSAPSHTQKYPRRFSQANRALIFVALGRPSTATARSLESSAELPRDTAMPLKDEERVVAVDGRMLEEEDLSVASQL
ncbi:hypothetical protein FB451DRAFT_1282036 [Mycena latifolia]|nr:hypothetical protein FB451DRAFT_1282036 [Mycena latifolia]